MNLKSLLLLLLTASSLQSTGQEILAIVTDSITKEPLVSATVQVRQNGILNSTSVSDFDGRCIIKPLEPGYYSVTVSYPAYKTATYTHVIVSPDMTTGIEFKLLQGKPTDQVIIKYKKPLVDKYKTNHVYKTAEPNNARMGSCTFGVTELTPGIYNPRKKRADDSARVAIQLTQPCTDRLKTNGANTYLIDGVSVQGSTGVDDYYCGSVKHTFRKISFSQMHHQHRSNKLARKGIKQAKTTKL